MDASSPPDDGAAVSEGIPPASSLFDELGVALIDRCSNAELRQLWYSCDQDRNDILGAHELGSLLETLSARWGDGRWKRGSSSWPASLPADDVEFEVLRARLWDAPEGGVDGACIFRLLGAFRAATGAAEAKVLPAAQAAAVADKLLASNRCAPPERLAVREAFATAIASEGDVDFSQFLAVVGRIYNDTVPSPRTGLLIDASIRDLPLDGVVRSGYEERAATPAELLLCGAEAMSAMLTEIKGARSEIMMSWWEFCAWLPVIRGARGVDAYEAQRADGSWPRSWEDSGTLPPVLKAKAESGVKIYILLYNAVDLVMPSAPVVEHTIEYLEKLHSNIRVVSSPGLFPVSVSHHQKFVVVDRSVAVLGGVDWTFCRWDTLRHDMFDPEQSVHPGLDASPPYMFPIEKWWEAPYESSGDSWGIDRQTQPCYPWQDVAVRVWKSAAEDVAQNFIERWNFVRSDEQSFFDKEMEHLDPEGAPLQPPAPLPPRQLSGAVPGRLKCQVVRSMGRWSRGGEGVDISHYAAWIKAINAAEHYIYIEQQYVISNMGEGAAHNRVCEAILNAVERALDAGREFRVMIVVPDQLEESFVLEPLSYFTRRTLLQDSPLGSRGEFAEEACLRTRIQRLLAEKRPGVEADPDSILSICGLAQAQKSPAGKWCTQSVFVHSKVLLVDDKYMVCGSANVNDRSLMGDRDSELGVLLTDDHEPDMIDSTMAGKPFRSGRTLLNFRLRTFRAFLGLDEGGADDGAIIDPVTAFGRLWSATAAKNRALLSAVFKYTPRDSITSFSQWSKIKEASFGEGDDDTGSPYVEGSDPDQLTEFRGLLVTYPRLFLGDQEKRSALERTLESIPVFQPGFL